MNLSENFTLDEAIRSHKADELHIDNSLPKDKLIDATAFAKNVIQPLRDRIGEIFDISSWWRCPGLNHAVGGVSTSAHLSATAIDFLIHGKTAKQTFDLVLIALKDLHITFDQIIIEKNTKTGVMWVHLGVKKKGNRNHSFALTVEP